MLALLLLAFELETLAKDILSDRKLNGISQIRADTGDSIKDVHGNWTKTPVCRSVHQHFLRKHISLKH